MKFGVREICDVVFKAKDTVTIGNSTFSKDQPVLYIDSAKTSTLEGSATTVYAQGGKGNTRLLAWEGEKTLTFTVEDALLSPIGFAILSGAGVIDASGTKTIYVHKTGIIAATAKGSGESTTYEVDISSLLGSQETMSSAKSAYIAAITDGSITQVNTLTLTGQTTKCTVSAAGNYFVDFYVAKTSGITQLEIEAGTFGGFYYVEASTLFRRESDGTDLPAEIVIPKVKIQSNFSFSMASTGDPSTFSFVMDAFPAYTTSNPDKEVLCEIQIYTDKSYQKTTT